jgi:hypothetical protein
VDTLPRDPDRGGCRTPLLEREALGAGLDRRGSPRACANRCCRSSSGSVKMEPGMRRTNRANPRRTLIRPRSRVDWPLNVTTAGSATLLPGRLLRSSFRTRWTSLGGGGGGGGG